MDNRNQDDYRIVPSDAALAVDFPGLRLTSRKAVVELVRSPPDEYADAMLALFVGGDFNLLSLDRLGPGNAADCALKPARLSHRGAKMGAIGVILIHHAPDRVLRPTPDEFRITKEIRRAGEDFDVHLLDHLIVTRDRLMDINP